MVAATISLPLGVPLVQSYLFLAYPLAILAGHGDVALPWILASFVQLYHRPGGDLKFYTHPWSPADHLRQVSLFTCPWLDVQHLDQRLPGTPLVPFLGHCIERGLYVQIDIDYGCLPGDPRRGWLHEILLTGVDRQARVFEALAYTAGGGFHSFRLDAETIETGTNAAAGLARQRPDSNERPRLLLYRFVPDTAAATPFNVEGLCDSLWDYLEAANSSTRHRSIAPTIQALWGIATSTWLESQILTCNNAASANRLAISLRVWWEHKRLMALCFTYLERQGLLDPDRGAGAEARHIADQAWKIRLIVLRWRQVPSCGQEQVAAMLREATARELDTAGHVVNALSGGHALRRAA